MKVIKYIALFFTLASFDATARDIDRYLSGSWYNPQQAGHGFSVEVLSSSRTLIYWYVYHPDGTPTFIIADGINTGNRVAAQAYYNTGMIFGEFDPGDRVQTPWGSLTLTWHSCNSATLQYDSDIDYNGEPWGSGSISLTRLANIEGVQCAPNPYAGLYQGNFYSEVLNQVIPGFAAIAPNGEFAAVSFDAMVGVGNYSVNGKNFSGSGIAVSADSDFTFSSNLSLSGQIGQGYAMWGNYTIVGGDRGSFEFYANSELYRRGISLAEIAGSYTAENIVSGGKGTATISASGQITASDSFGCSYQGQLSVPDPQFNLVEMSVTVSNCGVSNGTYEGYGAQIDYFNLEDKRAIRLVGTNGQFAGVIDLYR